MKIFFVLESNKKNTRNRATCHIWCKCYQLDQYLRREKLKSKKETNDNGQWEFRELIGRTNSELYYAFVNVFEMNVVTNFLNIVP